MRKRCSLNRTIERDPSFGLIPLYSSICHGLPQFPLVPVSCSRRLTAPILISIIFSAFALGCVEIPTPGIYKIDIQQGNVVTDDMLARLEPNMEKRKVRFLLGTPLVTDAFNENRWDYIYSLKQGGHEQIRKHIIVVFENDRLARIEGDVDISAIEATPAKKTEMVVSVPDKEPEGIFGGVDSWFGTDETKVPIEKPPPVDNELEENEEEGFFATIFDENENSSNDTPLEQQTQPIADDIEPIVAPLQSDQEPDSVVVEEYEVKSTADSDVGSEEDSFFARLKQKFGGEDESGQTSADNGAPASSSNEEPEEGFFERLSEQFGIDAPLEPSNGRN